MCARWVTVPCVIPLFGARVQKPRDGGNSPVLIRRFCRSSVEDQPETDEAIGVPDEAPAVIWLLGVPTSDGCQMTCLAVKRVSEG